MPALSRWRRFTAALPMRTALTGVGVVWLLGCVWSFEEQTNFAAAKGFTLPWLLPLVIDGLAAAMAGVAYAASLDARPAIAARLATALAVAASAASNGAWAWERSQGDPGTVALAVAIPIAANLAFEVLLSEMRRQVQRGRGQQPPVAVPYPRVIRLLLAPVSTFVTWRRLVLDLTDPRRTVALDLAAINGQVSPRAVPASVLAFEPPAEPAPQAGPVPDASAPAEERPGPTEPVPVVEQAGPDEPAEVAVRVGAAAPVRTAERTEPAVVRTAPRPRAPLTLRSEGPNGDERVHRIAELLSRGEELTGDTVGELFGCSPRTGRRLLAQGTALVSSNGHAG